MHFVLTGGVAFLQDACLLPLLLIGAAIPLQLIYLFLIFEMYSDGSMLNLVLKDFAK